ncbi:PTS galactitol transporter subunit IIC [Caldanaerobacter sp.]|uniref:PTS galactitol transporter subunit IIC n=1 Tax=Caldanaerobacter sp. TaxID=2930036 RepID=UPI003C78ED89
MKSIVQQILNYGPAMMMPIILFVLALIFRQSVGKSARAALVVGVAFIGISAVLGAVFGAIGPTVDAIAKEFGLSLQSLDVGWPLTAAITWGVAISAAIIPIAFIVNIILLLLNWTKTFDADVWNYWHWAFSAVMVYMWTKNIWLAYLVAIIVEIIILKLADWTAPLAQRYFNISGTSLPHTETVNWAPINLALEKLIFSRVPSLEKVKADPEGLVKKFGVFGEPIMLGFYVGILLGILGRQPVVDIFKTGIYLSALMLLQGRMIGILMEGLLPIANGISEYFARSTRFQNREIYIGIDAGPIGLANPTSIFVGYLMLPLVILFAFIPGNKILPLADLAILPIFVMWAAAASRGNVIKTFLNGLVSVILVMYITNAFAVPLTDAAKAINYAIPAGVVLVSSLDAGGHILPFIVILPIVAFASGKPEMAIVPIIIGILYFLAWYYAKDQPVKIVQKMDLEEGANVEAN